MSFDACTLPFTSKNPHLASVATKRYPLVLMKSSMRVYEYSGCSTCKKALKFLDSKGLAYEKVAIVDHPPTLEELKQMLRFQGGEIRKLFNTSGQLYREMKLGEKLGELSTEQALSLLASHGKLVKRPFLISAQKGLAGFKEAEWDSL